MSAALPQYLLLTKKILSDSWSILLSLFIPGFAVFFAPMYGNMLLELRLMQQAFHSPPSVL